MRVLIAEDDAATRRLLEALLAKWRYDVLVTTDGVQAWQLLQQEDAPSLAILDWMMPGMDGVEICRQLRQQDVQSYTYVLLLTSRAQKQDVVEGMESGADDYLAKPFHPEELAARLRAGSRIVELQSQLRRQATHDELTGLWNRRAVLDALHRELERARRGRFSVGVVIADIDHFKLVNDTYGHLSGDAVLRNAALRMRDNLRAYDFIGRWGGEEFLFVLPGCDLENAALQADRLRRLLNDEPLATPAGPLGVTLSLGVAAGAGVGAAQALLAAADDALYQAKRAGRNRVEIAECRLALG
jgi:diguanylate cyclase (GGDEF)-like protein